ncbi:NAD(P)H-binding protein [Dactylosporangium sp. NPDC049140]|uniref:NAD(P)-dependent oxidoreductase n=1 Tax=Dactylosporangium sp. NPDC049140 TaxID=3155647 RepID=UPI0033C01E65
MTDVVVFGAGGRAGRAVLAEARRRGLSATAVVRDPAKYPDLENAVAGDATDAELVARAAKGHATAIVAVYSAEQSEYAKATGRLLEGLERARVGRLLLVGLATTLGPVPDDFPAAWRPFVEGRGEELAVLGRYDGPVDWVVLTPPMELVEGPGTRYRTQTLGDPLTYAALAAALLDEAAENRHHRRQIAISGEG